VGDFLQIFLAFSEYLNFKNLDGSKIVLDLQKDKAYVIQEHENINATSEIISTHYANIGPVPGLSRLKCGPSTTIMYYLIADLKK
jgi:hypothetical protein